MGGGHRVLCGVSCFRVYLLFCFSSLVFFFAQAVHLGALENQSQAATIVDDDVRREDCTAKHSVGKCGGCFSGDYCAQDWFCCPRMKVCIKDGAMTCDATDSADCDPPCQEEDPDKCNCRDDFKMGDFAKPLCKEDEKDVEIPKEEQEEEKVEEGKSSNEEGGAQPDPKIPVEAGTNKDPKIPEMAEANQDSKTPVKAGTKKDPKIPRKGKAKKDPKTPVEAGKIPRKGKAKEDAKTHLNAFKKQAAKFHG